jgi:hypothetical protein
MGGNFCSLIIASLRMIIHNLDVVGISIPPFEADAPLVVNADTVLTLSVTRQFLETIRRWYAQILQDLSSIQNFESPSCNPLDILREFTRELTIEDSFRFLTREGLNHRPE